MQGYKDTWAGWSKSGARLMFRPNFTLDGYYFPVQYHEVFYDLYTFSAARGMVAVDMDSLTGHYGTQGLVNYVIATLNHNREDSLAELENDFYSAFGAASASVRQYFELVTDVSMKSGFKSPFTDNSIEGGILYLDLFLVADTLFTAEIMDKCWSLLNQASAATEPDSVAGRRVAFLKNGLKNAELVMAAQVEFRKYKQKQENSFADRVRELDQFRASVEDGNAINMGNARFLEDRHWPARAALSIYGKKSQEIKGWQILFDPDNTGIDKRWFDVRFDYANAEPIKTDSHWSKQKIGLDWEKRNGSQFLGTGWYFVRFDDIRDSDEQTLQILFEAIDGAANIYLNGRHIHQRPYPYKGNVDSWKEAFFISLPNDRLKAKDNLMSIRVEKHKGLAGIWKPASLVIK